MDYTQLNNPGSYGKKNNKATIKNKNGTASLGNMKLNEMDYNTFASTLETLDKGQLTKMGRRYAQLYREMSRTLGPDDDRLMKYTEGINAQVMEQAVALHRKGVSDDLIFYLTEAAAGLKSAGANIDEIFRATNVREDKIIATRNKLTTMQTQVEKRARASNVKLTARERQEISSWKLYADAIAIQIIEWMPDALVREFMQSEHFVLYKNGYGEEDSDGLIEYQNETGESLQTTRLKEFLDEKGMTVPRELLVKKPETKTGVKATSDEDFFKALRNRTNDPGRGF